MQKIIDGMTGAEITFLYLGIFFFVVLVILLIVFAVQKREIKTLLFFFILPLLMIGWSSIDTVKVSTDGIEFSRKGIKEAASDPAKRAELVKLTDSLNKTTVTNTDTLKLLAEANAILGDTLQAARKVEEVLEKKPLDKEALQLKNIFFTPGVVIQKGIEDVQANPNDEKAKLELKTTLIKEDLKTFNQTDPLKMAAAHLVLMDTAKATGYLENALEKKPELQNISNAKKVMMSKYIKK